jgi:hypothetical protein
MKNSIWMAGLILLAASCGNDTEVVNEEQALMAPVSVHVNDFAFSVEPFAQTRATAVADYSGINALTLAFYKSDNTQQYKTTQLKNTPSTYTTTFGDFNLSLPMGSYTMVVLAYYSIENSPLTLTSPTEASYTGAHAMETFAATQTVHITSTNAVDISATLNRIIAQLTVISSDGRAEGASKVRMTLSGGSRNFSPTSGLATDNDGLANTVNISAAVGTTSNSLTFLFLDRDEQEMDVTIETLDADGHTLFSKKVEKVPFKRNSVTKLTGSIYTNSSIGGAFQVSTDWGSERQVSF